MAETIFTGDDTTNGLPVYRHQATPVFLVNDADNPVNISGTISAEPPVGASTEAKQDSQITQETAIAAAVGVTSGAAVITDANGTIQQYLRGIVAKLVAAFLAANTARTTATLVLPVQNVDSFGKVQPVGSEYETVAASQTAQALGATGATGDYLSHVILQPTTTGAGTCTILDNATVIFTFTTGTLADLRPIIIPINAFSVSGAWKITTGGNVTATAFGDFT